MLVLLHPEFLEPRRARQHHVGMLARRVVHEEVVADDEILLRETCSDGVRIGVRRQHVGAEQEHDAQSPVEHCLGDARHLIRNVIAGRAAVDGEEIAVECLAVRRRAMAGPKPPPGTPRLPVSAGRHPMARPGCHPFAPLHIELPPKTIMAGFVVA